MDESANAYNSTNSTQLPLDEYCSNENFTLDLVIVSSVCLLADPYDSEDLPSFIFRNMLDIVPAPILAMTLPIARLLETLSLNARAWAKKSCCPLVVQKPRTICHRYHRRSLPQPTFTTCSWLR